MRLEVRQFLRRALRSAVLSELAGSAHLGIAGAVASDAVAPILAGRGPRATRSPRTRTDTEDVAGWCNAHAWKARVSARETGWRIPPGRLVSAPPAGSAASESSKKFRRLAGQPHAPSFDVRFAVGLALAHGGIKTER